MIPTDDQLINHEYENEYALSGYISSADGENIICPYCYHKQPTNDEGAYDYIEYCGKCEKEFTVRVITTISYETVRKEDVTSEN